MILALGACRREPAMSEHLDGIPLMPVATRVLEAEATSAGHLDSGDPKAGLGNETNAQQRAQTDDRERYLLAGTTVPLAKEWYAREMGRLGWHLLTDPEELPWLFLDAEGCQALVSMEDSENGILLKLRRQRIPCSSP